MDKPSGAKPVAKGHLPITSGKLPRPIPRPERYEVDDTPLSPPGSNYLLFDSSSVFNSHPHKYRLLIRSNSKDDLIHCPPTDSGHKPLGHRRSKSLASLSTLEADSATNAAVDSNIRANNPRTDHGEAAARDERALEQFLSSKHLSRSKSSESFIPDIRSNFGESYLFPYDHHSRGNETVGKDRLLRNLDEAVSLKEDNPIRFQVQPFEQTDNSMSSGIDAAAASRVKKPPPPSSSEDVNPQQPQYLVKEVQPEPRRLFGFGPLYRPLPEIVVEKQQPLAERVKQEGITAIGRESAKDTIDAPSTTQHRKTSASKETSMWMPFSF